MKKEERKVKVKEEISESGLWSLGLECRQRGNGKRSRRSGLGLGGLWAGRRGRPDLDLSDRPLTVSPPAHLTSGCSVTFLFYFLSRLAPSLLLLSHTDSLHTRWTPRALAMFFQPIFSSVHHMVSVSFPSILWETMLNFPPCCYNLNSWLLTLLLNLIKKKLDATGRLSKWYLQLLFPATLSANLQHYWYISVWVSSSFYLREAKESCRLQRLRHISVKNMNQCNKSSFLK